MNDKSGSDAGGTTKPSDGSGAGTAVPDLAGIANAITALTTFLKNGQATADRRPFTERQLGIEDDFRALLRGLGRREAVAPLGRFFWRTLTTGRVELVEPLPADIKEVGGYTADRRPRWRVEVPATLRDRRVLEHQDIDPEGVVRLRAFDGKGRRVLIGFPVEAGTPYPSPRI